MTTVQACPTRPWCTGEHNGYHPPLHRSRVRTVGPEPRHQGRGTLSAWLIAAGDGPTWFSVQAAHMASVTVELSPEDADEFHQLFGELIVEGRPG